MDSGIVLGNYRPVLFNLDPSVESVICLDSETSGLDPKIGHRMVSLGVVELFLKRPFDNCLGRQHEWRFNPGRKMDPDAIKTHGITDEEASEYGLFEDQYPEIIEFIGSEKPIVIYNAAFDKGFLDSEAALAKAPLLANPILDALEYARAGLPHRSSARLDDMMRHFGIKEERDVHGALKDARILGLVFKRMYEASLNVGRNFNDQMRFLNPMEGLTAARRSDRKIMIPTEEEITIHNQFMSKISPKN
jgi:DNA polymerase-3 subunit epsilon